jgi:hypothetical protein
MIDPLQEVAGLAAVALEDGSIGVIDVAAAVRVGGEEITFDGKGLRRRLRAPSSRSSLLG